MHKYGTKPLSVFCVDILIFVLIWILLPNFLFCAKELSVAEVIENSKPSIVKILVIDKLGRLIGWGSGFFISPQEILTCAHVIWDAYSAGIVADENNYGEVTILKMAVEVDLALLRIHETNRKDYLLLSKDKGIQAEECIISMGYPDEQIKLGFEGKVIEIDEESWQGFQELKHSAYVLHGMSGGPVLNLEGYVIGVNNGGQSAIGIKTINEFFNSPDDPKQLPKAGSCVLWAWFLREIIYKNVIVNIGVAFIFIFSGGWLQGVFVILLAGCLIGWRLTILKRSVKSNRRRKDINRIFEF